MSWGIDQCRAFRQPGRAARNPTWLCGRGSHEQQKHVDFCCWLAFALMSHARVACHFKADLLLTVTSWLRSRTEVGDRRRLWTRKQLRWVCLSVHQSCWWGANECKPQHSTAPHKQTQRLTQEKEGSIYTRALPPRQVLTISPDESPRRALATHKKSAPRPRGRHTTYF